MERTILKAFDGAATGVDPVIDGDPIIGGDISDHMDGVGRRSYVSIVGQHGLRGGWTESLRMERTILKASDRTATGVDPVIDGNPIIRGNISDHMDSVGRL